MLRALQAPQTTSGYASAHFGQWWRPTWMLWSKPSSQAQSESISYCNTSQGLNKSDRNEGVSSKQRRIRVGLCSRTALLHTFKRFSSTSLKRFSFVTLLYSIIKMARAFPDPCCWFCAKVCSGARVIQGVSTACD